MDEDSPTEPASESARALVETERYLLAAGGAIGVPVTILRLSGIVGPGRGPLNRVIGYAGTQRPDPNDYVNLVHVDDIVAACVGLLDRPFDGILNLTSDEPVLRRAYYDHLLRQAGAAPIRWIPDSRPMPGGKRIRNDRARRWLGLTLRNPQ